MRTPTLPTVYGVASIAIPLLLFATLAAWAFSSTVGSSPDDDFHLASIWCGLGLREGLCEESGDVSTRLVPAALVDVACFAHYPAVSGACWSPESTGLAEATWLNTAGLYPPVFYAVMSLFAGQDIQISVLAMRLFNSALAVAFITTVFFALPRHIRPALIVSALVATVPLGLFVLASTNPSSWALLSAATVWIALYGAFRTTGRRQTALCILAIAGAVFGAGARGDAAAFAVFGVVISLVLGVKRGRAMLVPSIAAAVIVVGSGLFFLTTGHGSVVGTGMEAGESGPLSSADHISNLLGIPGLWLGAFGATALGWFDTDLPSLVPVLAFGAYCASIAIGVRVVGGRRSLALAMAVAALVVVPFVLLAQSGYLVGYNLVQPRYTLPLLIILLGVAALSRRAEFEWSVARVLIFGAALSVAVSASLHINISRYTQGSDRPSIDPGADAEWWWSVAPPPMAVWIIGSLAFTLVFALLAIVQWAGYRSAEFQSGGAELASRSPTDDRGHASIGASPSAHDGPPSARV